MKHRIYVLAAPVPQSTEEVVLLNRRGGIPFGDINAKELVTPGITERGLYFATMFILQEVLGPVVGLEVSILGLSTPRFRGMGRLDEANTTSTLVVASYTTQGKVESLGESPAQVVPVTELGKYLRLPDIGHLWALKRTCRWLDRPQQVTEQRRAHRHHPPPPWLVLT